jgi:hypothetical protein
MIFDGVVVVGVFAGALTFSSEFPLLAANPDEGTYAAEIV